MYIKHDTIGLETAKRYRESNTRGYCKTLGLEQLETSVVKCFNCICYDAILPVTSTSKLLHTLVRALRSWKKMSCSPGV